MCLSVVLVNASAFCLAVASLTRIRPSLFQPGTVCHLFCFVFHCHHIPNQCISTFQPCFSVLWSHPSLLTFHFHSTFILMRNLPFLNLGYILKVVLSMSLWLSPFMKYCRFTLLLGFKRIIVLNLNLLSHHSFLLCRIWQHLLALFLRTTLLMWTMHRYKPQIKIDIATGIKDGENPMWSNNIFHLNKR